MKVEIVRIAGDARKFIEEVNKFIEDEKVIDIKFEEKVVPVGTFFYKELEIVQTAFIMYEDK